MDEAQLKCILEAALFAAGEPLSVERMQELFGEEQAPAKESIRTALEGLRGEWLGRGLELAEVASGFRFQVRQSFSPWISRLWEERPPRYSRALLETLALVAYRQPITRAEIEDIRGVTVSSNIIKMLQEREWIRVVGHRDVPGKPAMYATTRQFLDYFNLKSLDDLPSLAELRDIDLIGQELDLQLPAVSGTPSGEGDEAPDAVPESGDEPSDDAVEAAEPEFEDGLFAAELAEDAADDDADTLDDVDETSPTGELEYEVGLSHREQQEPADAEVGDAEPDIGAEAGELEREEWSHPQDEEPAPAEADGDSEPLVDMGEDDQQGRRTPETSLEG